MVDQTEGALAPKRKTVEAAARDDGTADSGAVGATSADGRRIAIPNPRARMTGNITRGNRGPSDGAGVRMNTSRPTGWCGRLRSRSVQQSHSDTDVTFATEA